jgi:hypothetical protein
VEDSLPGLIRRAPDAQVDPLVLFRVLTKIHEPAQPLELIILCGWFRTLSTVITSVGLPCEPWAARIAPA